MSSVKYVRLLIIFILSCLSEDTRSCSVTRDNCEVVYELEVDVLGTENETIYIYIDDTQSDYREWRSNPSM